MPGSHLQPSPVTQNPQMPSRQINGSSGTLSTSAPVNKTDASGKVPDYGFVMVEVSGACTVSLYLWSGQSNSWQLYGNTPSRNAIAFTASGMDFFQAPAGATFALKSDTASISCYSDADKAPGSTNNS